MLFAQIEPPSSALADCLLLSRCLSLHPPKILELLDLPEFLLLLLSVNEAFNNFCFTD